MDRAGIFTMTSTQMGAGAGTGPHRTGRGAWLALVAAFLGWMFDGMEMGIFPLVARPALQEMQEAGARSEGSAVPVGEQYVQKWMGRITALFLLGAAAGGL